LGLENGLAVVETSDVAENIEDDIENFHQEEIVGFAKNLNFVDKDPFAQGNNFRNSCEEREIVRVNLNFGVSTLSFFDLFIV
jgi:hypothetical protein